MPFATDDIATRAAARWAVGLAGAVLLVVAAACRPVPLAVQETGGGTEEAAVATSRASAPAVVPLPRAADWSGAPLALPETLRCAAADPSLDPLLDVLDYEYHMLTGGHVRPAREGEDAACRLAVDTALEEEAHRLVVDDAITLTGGSYRGVAMGSVTLMQTLYRHGAGYAVPRGTVQDAPRKAYRGLMIDVARQWHDVHTLRQLILLCRWYKINYLHLHLTDDQSFTFPTESFPELPTPGRHYTKEQLRELDAFARDRGVVLVPELEVPGHAAQLTQRLPHLFGIGEPQPVDGIINMGREAVYEALDRIVAEFAEVFETSPYLHIGGDEAKLERLEGNEAVERYLAAHGLADVQALYRHFLVRMHAIVEKHGKQALVWEGFRAQGDVQVPRDVIVMAWETLYQLPQELLDGGYPVINVTWKPLYVAGRRKWDPATIYAWNPYRWENWLPRAPSYTPIQLPPTPQVIGASMASWAQPQHLELPTVRRRLPAMSERTWHAALDAPRPVAAFLRALEATDAALSDVLSPIDIRAEGLRYPDLEEGQDNEQFWFGDTLTVTLAADSNQAVYYTLDGRMPTPQARRYERPVTLIESAAFRARAFTPAGHPVGYARWVEYSFRPIEARVEGALATPLDALWETARSWEAAFTGTLTITLASERAGVIRYTTDGTEPSPSAPAYTGPIRLSTSAVVKAQLYDAAGTPLGHPWVQHFKHTDE